MALFLVGYDLIAKTKKKRTETDYKPLYELLEKKGAYWHLLDSTWLLETKQTAENLRNELLQVLDGDDRILVINITTQSAAWSGFSEEGSEWIKARWPGASRVA
ncbi:hypothetical protein [Vulgatibacter incomptus]|uniref:SinR-like protein n=1 Tax=Vulgatibacter incomptus TaxID=1391653 RepID=A0A0K1PGW1_9BACT|nr:hypothetical protein [Vulgatibacter incomptus]AKU92768.1 hypothetical protein AKJ08_3155 [Vulgatibacter incomptus]